MSYTLGIISILQSIRRIMCSTCVKQRHGVLNTALGWVATIEDTLFVDICGI